MKWMIISSKFGAVWSFFSFFPHTLIKPPWLSASEPQRWALRCSQLGWRRIWSLCERRAWNTRRHYRISLASSLFRSASLASLLLPSQPVCFQPSPLRVAAARSRTATRGGQKAKDGCRQPQSWASERNTVLFSVHKNELARISQRSSATWLKCCCLMTPFTFDPLSSLWW